MNRYISLLLFAFYLVSLVLAQPMAEEVSIEQLRDGSGLVKICYKAVNPVDSFISTNVLVTELGMFDEFLPVLTLRDTLSGYDAPNFGWRVSASDTGEIHCFLWDMTTDLGDVENCGFRGNVAVFDSVLSSYSITDSFPANDSARVTERAFGLAYKRGELWLMFHEGATDHCWVRPYTLPDLVPGDSTFIGTVEVGPSDMAFAGDRLFWVEDTRVILKEFDWELGDSRAVRSDWWDLPGTAVHLAGCAFDGEYLWVCFSEGTFVKMDTSTFSLVDTMFFPEFGVSTPATSADGLAWGLGILWCFSNDNVVYAIDTETKTIIHTIFTGAVVEMTGAEGAAWDGLNLWVVDYSRYHVYKLSLFEQITFYFSNIFCLDNQKPQLSWMMPDTLGIDTFVAGWDTTLLWTAVDSNLIGSTTEIMLWEDTIVTLYDSTFDYTWTTIDWPGFTGHFQLSVTDFFGNQTRLNSGRFYLEENFAPMFLDCSADIIVEEGAEISIPIGFYDREDDYITVSFVGPSDAIFEGDSLIRWTTPEIPSDTTHFEVVICDFHLCDTCSFSIMTEPNLPPFFVHCPGTLSFIEGDIVEIPVIYEDPESDAVDMELTGPDFLFLDYEVLRGVADTIGFFDVGLFLCDEYSCDSCSFVVEVSPDLPPYFISCPTDTFYAFGDELSIIFDFLVEDPYGRSASFLVMSDLETHLIADTQLIVIPETEGAYPIEIVACTGELCDTCSFILSVFGEGIDEYLLPDEKLIRIAPNPFNSHVEISSPEPWVSLQIHDLSGREIDSYGHARVLRWSPQGHVRSGIYFVSIEFESGRRDVKRMLLIK